MKKILTLLFAATAFVSLHAQSREETRRVILGGEKGNNNGTYGGNNNGRDVILGGGNNGGQYPTTTYPGNTYPSSGNRQYEIDQINREYDAKIQSIRNNQYLSYQEKERAIRQLEQDRARRIREISRYNDRNDNYNDDRPNRPHDNGKHKGWYKNNKKGKRDRDWDDD